ncbi:hypothetical protein ACQP00_49615 [Dactylosporangium sp. CS-047395]|uniref:hypothetical protein n=1 Tax=Dactylosporangium sp. CS-047395 TaxID=3239936 RepID=UPI003D90458E
MSDIAAVGDGPSEPTQQPVGLRLAGQQRALHEALGALAAELGAMYLGALMVLQQPANTQRFAQAAHVLREMINRVPKSLGYANKAMQERMGDRLGPAEQSWDIAVAKSGTFNNGAWSGEIDQHLRKALTALYEFFTWKKGHQPKRRDEMTATLRKLDASGRRLPDKLESLAVDEWSITRDYFISICHYQKPADEQEFLAYLDALERFLLDRLRPRTFADFDAVDAILEEASRGSD